MNQTSAHLCAFPMPPPPPRLSSHVTSFLICHSHLELSFCLVNFFMFKTLGSCLHSFILKMCPYGLILLSINLILLYWYICQITLEVIKWDDYAIKWSMKFLALGSVVDTVLWNVCRSCSGYCVWQLRCCVRGGNWVQLLLPAALTLEGHKRVMLVPSEGLALDAPCQNTSLLLRSSWE
jgi:hypothetical protein